MGRNRFLRAYKKDIKGFLKQFRNSQTSLRARTNNHTKRLTFRNDGFEVGQEMPSTNRGRIYPLSEPNSLSSEVVLHEGK